MKILWLCDKYFDISVDRITWIEGIQYLQKFNHDVTLATGYRYSKQRFELGDSLKYIGTLHFPFLGSCLFAMHLLFWVTRYVVRYKPNIIILDPFAYLDIFPLVFLSRFQIFKTRFILDIRTIPVESYGIKQRINNRLFDFAVRTSNFLVDGMTVITPFMKIILTKKYNLRRFDIGVWTSGASLNKFQPNHIDKNELTKLESELKLKDKFIIIYHGVITHSRGLFETIEALNILKNTYKNISLLLIGEGAAKKELQKFLKTRKRSFKKLLKKIDCIRRSYSLIRSRTKKLPYILLLLMSGFFHFRIYYGGA